MRSDWLVEEFLDAIRQRADARFKKSLPLAFVDWYVEAEFGRSARWEFTDDSGDGGVDAIVWLPNERPPVMVLQSKFSENIARSLLSKTAYRNFSDVVEAFYDEDQFGDFLTHVRDDAKRIYRKAHERLEDAGNWLTQKRAFRVITTCRRRAGSEDKSLPKTAYQYSDNILALYAQYRKGHTPRPPDLHLELIDKLPYKDPKRRVASYLFNARVSDFRKYFDQNDVARLVARNIRYNLGGRIGRQIRETYEGQPHDFWYMHNGITIICDRFSEDDQVATLENPSVVNGAQTLYAIAASSRKLSPALVATRVIVRSAQEQLEHEDDVWVQSVIRGVNTQNRVRAQDFRSNEPEQLELQELFREQRVFYERKRGEWKEVRNEPRFRKFDRTSIRAIAMTLTATSEADGSGVLMVKRGVEATFQPKNYDRLFPQRRKIARRFERIYLAYRIYRFVGANAYSSAKEYRRQQHAFWTTVWLVHRGITSVPRFGSRVTVDSIRRAFDILEERGRAGQRAAATVRATRAAVWAAWKQGRRTDPELWNSINFFKSRFGHSKVLRIAFPRVRTQLVALGRFICE